VLRTVSVIAEAQRTQRNAEPILVGGQARNGLLHCTCRYLSESGRPTVRRSME
jgi:hypothetical protein